MRFDDGEETHHAHVSEEERRLQAAAHLRSVRVEVDRVGEHEEPRGTENKKNVIRI